MQPIITWPQKMLFKQKLAAFIKWIARFYYFRHLYSAGSACVLLTIIAWVAHRYGQLYLLLINILLGSFQLFLHSDQPLSEGEIIPFSGVCQSGEAALSTPWRIVVLLHLLMTNCFWYYVTAIAAASSRRASFSALASANSFVYLHRAQQHHADASACQ